MLTDQKYHQPKTLLSEFWLVAVLTLGWVLYAVLYSGVPAEHPRECQPAVTGGYGKCMGEHTFWMEGF